MKIYSIPSAIQYVANINNVNVNWCNSDSESAFFLSSKRTTIKVITYANIAVIIIESVFYNALLINWMVIVKTKNNTNHMINLIMFLIKRFIMIETI